MIHDLGKMCLQRDSTVYSTAIKPKFRNLLVVGRTAFDGTRTVVGRTVIGRMVVSRTIVGSIVVGIWEVFHRERGNMFDGVVSSGENIPGMYVGIGFCC